MNLAHYALESVNMNLNVKDINPAMKYGLLLTQKGALT